LGALFVVSGSFGQPLIVPQLLRIEQSINPVN